MKKISLTKNKKSVTFAKKNLVPIVTTTKLPSIKSMKQ